MVLSINLSTDLQAGAVRLILHTIPDQITGITAIPAVTTETADRDTTDITTETGDSNNTQDMTREIQATKTGMVTVKMETGSTTEEDPTNINITETNPKHKSFLNTQTRTY